MNSRDILIALTKKYFLGEIDDKNTRSYAVEENVVEKGRESA